jgi:hypothetical protein
VFLRGGWRRRRAPAARPRTGFTSITGVPDTKSQPLSTSMGELGFSAPGARSCTLTRRHRDRPTALGRCGLRVDSTPVRPPLSAGASTNALKWRSRSARESASSSFSGSPPPSPPAAPARRRSARVCGGGGFAPRAAPPILCREEFASNKNSTNTWLYASNPRSASAGMAGDNSTCARACGASMGWRGVPQRPRKGDAMRPMGSTG